MKAETKYPALETARLKLTLPSPGDAPRMLAFVEDNRDHFARWDPAPAEDYYTIAFWHGRLQMARDDFLNGRSMRLVITRRDDDSGRVVGECNFNNFVRGVFQACYLGYRIDHRDEGQGLMHEALYAAIIYVFSDLRIHRIMANYIPANERSGRLLRRLGFSVEGYARDYLLIAGRWEDHILTALANPDWTSE